jgi:hypothetical protein
MDQTKHEQECAIVTTTILAICVPLIAGMYFVFMFIFMFSIGVVMFLIYPLLFGLRVAILLVIALIYYVLRSISVIKTCCFITEESVPV